MFLLDLLLGVAQPIGNKVCDRLYVGTARRERGPARWRCPSQWGVPARSQKPAPALAGAPGQRKAPGQTLCVLRSDYEWSTITGLSTPFTKIYKL